jgi:non-ribosomal peptide synthetase component E (peptide arylation enzyme)
MTAAHKTIAAVLDATALRFPARRALVSPFQSHSFTYEELRQTTDALAGFLQLYGFERRDMLISDMPNTTENLLLQLACNRLGVYYGTVKTLEQMAQFAKVKGAVAATSSGFLADTNLPLPFLSGDFLVDMIHGGGKSMGMSLDDYALEHHDQETAVQEDDTSTPHAFYNSTTPYTNQQALQHGEEAAEELIVVQQDVVCISITLCHAFGMGSAVGSALLRGACMALPAVGGIQGCGVPSERAAATFEVLESEKCTLLFADTHTLKALPDEPLRVNLRGGVCKIGSGSDWLDETRTYGGIKLKTMGKRE